ncbi:MAG: 2-oxoglutarate dehydrogenase, E2 component, dihydrolipoamide succinyltransferase, partial [Nocardioidaceae bacterium]
MATEVTLPALGESVTEGTVTQWLKSVGDEVAVDEALLEVSTDKVDTGIPSPVAGTLLEIKADEDETVEVGAVLALIGDKDEAGESGGSGGESSDGDSESDSDSDSEGESGGSDQPAANGGQDADDSEQASQPSAAEESPQTDEGAEDTAPSGQEDAAKADAQPSGDSESSSGDSTDSESSSGDSTNVTLPALGESVTEGTVTQWLKSVGDEVAVDEPLLEVSTDKVDTEIPSPVAGTLLEIKVDSDETVEVGAVLAVIGSAGASAGGAESADSGDAGSDEQDDAAGQNAATDESGSAEAKPETDSDAATAESASTQESADEAEDQEVEEPSEPQGQPAEPQSRDAASAPSQGGGSQPAAASAVSGSVVPAEPTTDGSAAGETESRGYVTPLVRKLATQHNVELSSLSGSGVGGRIRKQDVLAAAEAAKQQSAPAADIASSSDQGAPAGGGQPRVTASSLRGKTEKLSRLRKVIAARMVESMQTSAQLTTVVEVDVTAISRLRDKAKGGFEQREGVKLSFLPFFAKAAVDALKIYPQVNASIDTEAGTVTYHDGEHLGVAVDTERGLLVPVIRDAGDLSIAGLARKIADLAARTRDNKITPDELSGGTFTLTNTGSRGALFDTPIINQPQVAILGTGTVVKRPVVITDDRLGETIAVRQMVYLSLTYDHRLVDGA